jgi:hypothetical protein
MPEPTKHLRGVGGTGACFSAFGEVSLIYRGI